MDPERPDLIDQRLTDLEIKASFSEDAIEQLNQVVIRQQTQIDQLRRELATQRELARTDVPGTPRSLRDDLPPHY